MNKSKLRIIHETNPHKYFPALYDLASRGVVELTGAHRYSVGKEWMRAWLRDRTPLLERTHNALGDLAIRLRIPFIKGETIVFGFAPWDWRLLLYRRLARNNHILYQTSWHDWRLDKTPRQPAPNWFKLYLQRQWHKFLSHPKVHTIAVTPTVAQTVLQETGVKATVIPHAVPEVFFDAAKTRSLKHHAPLRLLYVGELSEKKGIKTLLKIMQQLTDEAVTLSVVGNGPLASEINASPHNVNYLGPIRDRTRLAKVMSSHDVLMLLSQKTETWEELFGIVIIEALAAGCGVVASNHIGPKGILAPVNGLGLFPEESEAEIVTLLRLFINDPDKLATFAQEQNTVVRPYSLKSVSEQWLTLINMNSIYIKK